MCAVSQTGSCSAWLHSSSILHRCFLIIYLLPSPSFLAIWYVHLRTARLVPIISGSPLGVHFSGVLELVRLVFQLAGSLKLPCPGPRLFPGEDVRPHPPCGLRFFSSHPCRYPNPPGAAFRHALFPAPLLFTFRSFFLSFLSPLPPVTEQVTVDWMVNSPVPITPCALPTIFFTTACLDTALSLLLCHRPRISSPFFFRSVWLQVVRHWFFPPRFKSIFKCFSS